MKPEVKENIGMYILFLETLNQFNNEDLANSIDSALTDNIYYAQARKSGQLARFKIESLLVIQ